jgi:hypothetical protein
MISEPAEENAKKAQINANFQDYVNTITKQSALILKICVQNPTVINH